MAADSEGVRRAHYVPVSADLSDLADAVLWCRANDDAARAIAERGRELALLRMGNERALLQYMQLVLARVAEAQHRRVSLFTAEARDGGVGEPTGCEDERGTQEAEDVKEGEIISEGFHPWSTPWRDRYAGRGWPPPPLHLE